MPLKVLALFHSCANSCRHKPPSAADPFAERRMHRTLRRAASILQNVAAHQICVVHFLNRMREYNPDLLPIAPFTQGADRQALDNAMVQPGPIVACHAGEPPLLLTAVPQHELLMGAGWVRAARALGWAFASTMIRPLEEQRHLADAEFAVAGDEWEHAAHEAQVEMALVAVRPVTMKQFPGIGEVVPQIEQTPPGAGQVAFARFQRGAAQDFAALSRCVVQVHDDVAQGLHLEVIVLVRQLDTASG